MNRALVLGVAVFFALVGVCLMGSDNAVVAGHGCSCDCGGCDCGGCDCDCGGCGGHGLFGHKKKSCCGCSGHSSCCGNSCCNDCCPPPSCCGCAGGYAPMEAVEPAPVEEAAPAPAAQRKPFGFRSVKFRR